MRQMTQIMKKKASKCHVDESDYKAACKVTECQGGFKQESKVVESANVLVKDLKQDVEKGCMKCEKLKKKIVDMLKQCVKY